ncbi:glycoside hydrolase family 10 protein [Cyanobacterium sp. Dongsha4]|uniref:glycoside hydrolase family 10 protein n=1 Tax=Cyanobacterium sp. DS4 TaxID=2878255 RepID=UPI002E7FE3D8|nr:glycoside hydrolase family 10 protein [Cyanobacterium sp. Dongsha4]WVK99542.1 glycoside hydrolase family 10 protein [Cyanobacterium sp. Dongsha4]
MSSFLIRQWLSLLPFKLLSLFFASYFSILLIGFWNAPIFSQDAPEIRAVWLTTSDTDTLLDRPKMKEAIASLASLHFNTIYPVVWNSGYALYPSKVAQEAKIQPFVHKGLQGQEPLGELIEEAHKHKMLVLPWFEFGFMAPPSSELALKHPNWLTKAQDGTQTTYSAAGEVVWLNPFHPEVQKFITALVMEVVNNYDIDGIQFDDHLCLPVQLGYDAYTVNLYKQETGLEPPKNYKDADWMRWRANKLTEFVAQLNQTIKAQNPNKILSISPNPYHTAYNSFLQDWLDWVRKNLIDELIIQVYRSDFAVFQKEISRPEIKEAKEKIPVGIAILTGLPNRITPIEFVREKALAVRQQRLGIAFFFYGSMWNTSPELKSDRKSSFQSLFPYQSRRIVTVNPNTPIITPTNSVTPVTSTKPVTPITPSNPITPVTSTNNVVNPTNKVTPTNVPIIDSSIDPTNVTSEPIPIDEFLEFSP